MWFHLAVLVMFAYWQVQEMVSNGTYWQVLAEGDGTDVGTTLTTQGDILYRDGSGFPKISKGGKPSFKNE